MAEVIRLLMRGEFIVNVKYLDIMIWRKTVVADLMVLSRQTYGEMNAINILSLQGGQNSKRTLATYHFTSLATHFLTFAGP
jgi:hypothetical protein